ncbi:NDP-sugar synthase [bacterium]|nr:MAG: NDP-sugar synthase [bacterium]
MKAILLAAGKSARLGKITKNIPKPMLKIKNEIVLAHNIEWLKKYNIKDIYINLHYLPDIIKSYFGDGSKWKVKINYSYEKNILGTAGGVKKIINIYEKDNWKEDFLVVYGDSFYPFSYNIDKLIDFQKEKNALVSMGLYKRKSEIWKSGVALIADNGRIKKFVEKPDPKKINSNLVNTGIYIVHPKIVKYIPDGFSDFAQDIFPKLLREKLPIYGYVFGEGLIPIDTPKLLKKANR